LINSTTFPEAWSFREGKRISHGRTGLPLIHEKQLASTCIKIHPAVG